MVKGLSRQGHPHGHRSAQLIPSTWEAIDRIKETECFNHQPVYNLLSNLSASSLCPVLFIVHFLVNFLNAMFLLSIVSSIRVCLLTVFDEQFIFFICTYFYMYTYNVIRDSIAIVT